MIGIIGAMEEEITILKEKLINTQYHTIAHVEFYQGKLNDVDVVLTRSGIGKVNAAISTTLLIQQFKPEMIINTGSAGALDEDLSIGDVVVSDSVIYHDVDATAFGYQYGQVPQMPLHFEADKHLLDNVLVVLKAQSLNAKVGLIVSGDSFIGSTDQRLLIKERFPQALAVEMEATAIAQTCHQFKQSFIITRAISDLANGNADITFEQFIEQAAVSASKTVERLIKQI